MKRKQRIQIVIASILVCLVTLGCGSSQQAIAPNQPSDPVTSSASPSLTREQQIAAAKDQQAREFPPCGDRSQAYEKLRLKEVDPVFRLCAAELLKRTKIPIVLPPNSQLISDQPLQAHLPLPSSNANMYWITVVQASEEVSPPVVATFTGARAIPLLSASLRSSHERHIELLQRGLASARAKTDSRLRANLQAALQASDRVYLARGITAYYAAGVCPANDPRVCRIITDEIAWEDQGVQYRISIPIGGGKAKLLQLANAAIENQRPTNSLRQFLRKFLP